MARTPRRNNAGTEPTVVEAFTHQDDQRTNIPTAELETFLKDEDRAPARVEYPRPSNLLYPRDPSGDPQLVWRGKDEQDGRPFTAMAPPIYIREKIHPKVLIEELRRERTHAVPSQIDLFGDFNGISFDDMVDFYQHEQHWTNRMILGDSLEVMASLAEREVLRHQVQCIYFDPPYGIDFRSNWQVSTRERDVSDRAEGTTRQPEQVRAFRDTWNDGVHSYLSYLRDRLIAAVALLREDGSLFLQIGDENVHRARALLDEVFGQKNHIATIVVKKKGSQRSTFLDPVNDYILWYARRSRQDGGPKYRPLYEERRLDADTGADFPFVELVDGRVAALSAVPVGDSTVDLRENPAELAAVAPGARLFAANPLTSGGYRRTQSVPYAFGDHEFAPKHGQSWKHSAFTDDGGPCGMDRLAWSGRLIPAKTTWRFKRYLSDFPYRAISNWWDGIGGASNPVYAVQTNVEIVRRCVLMTTDPGDIVLDPTCGSGTSAVVAEQWGRRWITIDTSRVAITLARTRLMSTRYPYYELSDEVGRDLRRGFRLQEVPHITSTSIANDELIQPDQRREEIDRLLVQHAPLERIVDRPRVVSKVVRVTGPFTVESLSPSGVVTMPEPARVAAGSDDEPAFHEVILDNLRAAGVENSVRGQRLVFDRLVEWPGQYIHGRGEYREVGALKTAAVTIGPRYGTVDADFVRDAAREAAGYFDTLLVCGFAFDSYLSSEMKRLGNLAVLKVSMNPDLSMGGDLLKKTGSGNLFTVFGEPDIDIRRAGGQLEVEIKGLDVYDPTTGQIRSHTTDDIACWFIDTAYDGNSFFVRHAYFTGAGDPYKSLKDALKADVDPEVWATLYSTVSRRFDVPQSGRIAVKVINHFGDEVMKVYDVASDDH